MEEEISFDMWNEQKKKIQLGDLKYQLFPKEGEVWMCTIGKNIGFEQNGSGPRFSRPVLVIKKFNNKMYWVIPLSSKQKSIDFYYNFLDPNCMKVSLVLAQMKNMSSNRFKRKMYDLQGNIFESVRIKLMEFLI